MKLLNAFKAISKHLTPFTKKDLRIFTNACKEGDLENIKDLLENKRLRIINLPTDALPYIWKAEVLDYLMTSPLSYEYHNLNPRKLIENAGAYGYLEIIEYFRTNNKVEFDYELINERILPKATEYGNVKVIEYLFNTPDIYKKLELEKAYTSFFITAFFQDRMDILHHLIMDVKIKKNEEIEKYLKLQMGSVYSKSDANTINNLFEMQNLAQSSNQNKKRNKL